MTKKNKKYNKLSNKSEQVDKSKFSNEIDQTEKYGKYKTTIENINNLIYSSIVSKPPEQSQKFRILAIKELQNIIDKLDITDYLLIDCKPELSTDAFVECCFNLGTLIKNFTEIDLEVKNHRYTKEHEQKFKDAIFYLIKIIRVKFYDIHAIDQISSIYTKLCFYNETNTDICLQFLHDALLVDTTNPIIHYNLAFIYARINKLDSSLIHYKLSNKLITVNNNEHRFDDNMKINMYLNNYNGLSFIYRSIKQWPEALYYLKKAEELKPDDPDILNQLGVVYTEMRRTDLAENSYLSAIKNYEKTLISSNAKQLLSEIYLNYGHMFSYNGDNNKSIEYYNKSLSVSPNFHLPFQNKIMNLSYIFDNLEDKMYILKQHQLINKLYKHGNGKYKFDNNFFNSNLSNGKINIGIVSGDFVDHPVSYFISNFLKKYNINNFKITCYSECVIDTKLFNEKICFKFIKNMSQEMAADLIYNDNIHILFDLAGHTAFNRLDVFALKPSPIQITYVGYPFSTGLNEMDYRITDAVCDNIEISQKFYSEKLLFTKGCFLSYKSNDIPQLSKQPFLQNGWITLGCFNRLNKINDRLINGLNIMLLKNKTIRLVFKTKALLNHMVRTDFINKFDKSVRDRINVKDCNITHFQHLLEYNNIDVAIDTMPYSGTTTSCEALLMGVPVFTFYDNTTYFHPQNVTSSILKHSHPDFCDWIINDIPENKQPFYDLLNKINDLQSKNNSFWQNLKNDIRNKFLSGDVCNGDKWVNDFQQLLFNLYQNKKSEL